MTCLCIVTLVFPSVDPLFLLYFLFFLFNCFHSFSPIQLSVNDSLFTDTASFQISIQLLNDEPPVVVTNITSFTYTEGGPPISILDTTATITDDDNRISDDVVTQVCANITNPQLGDELSFDLNISTVLLSDGSVLCVDLKPCKNDFIDDTCFNDVLQGIEYNNTKDEPNLTQRIITLTVSCIYIYKCVLSNHICH